MNRSIVVVLGLLAVSECAWGQGLGDAARREKERREKAHQGEPPAKVVTDEELKNNRGALANDPSIPPAAVLGPPDRSGSTSRRVATSAGGSGSSASPISTAAPSGGSEGVWRSGIRTLRDNIARLEKEVATLDAKANGFIYGPTTSGRPRGGGVETDASRQAREGNNAANSLSWQQARGDALDRLERAKSSLVKAKADLVAFEESARRQSVPPGWLRE